MNHKNRTDACRRPKSKIKSPQQFILYVEGKNTEKSYFDLLKRANCKITPVTKRGHGISKCLDFVNDSEKAWYSLPKDERAKYNQRWLLFDADGRNDFEKAVKLAREKGFGVAFSNMCIEYWFMLHFYDHDGSPVPLQDGSHSKAQIKRINEFIEKYNKTNNADLPGYDCGSKTVDADFLDLMLAIEKTSKKRRIVLAYERAKAIHERKKRNGAEFKESVTTIYELLFSLGVIEQTKDGFRLFYKI